MNETSIPGTRRRETEILTVIGIGLISGLLTRIPMLFPDIEADLFYLRNLFPVVFTGLIAYTLWINRIGGWARLTGLATGMALLLLFVNTVPDGKTDSAILSYIHVPLLLWCLFGLTWLSFNHRDPAGRAAFIRFNGEWLILMGLILLAAGALTALAIGLFSVIRIDIEEFSVSYVAFFTCAAAPVVSFYLLRSFPGVAGRITPVLARIFTPVVLFMLLIFLTAFLVSGNRLAADRDLLIVFNGMLLVVTAVIVFSVTELDKTVKRNLQLIILFLLAVAALAADAMALAAILRRLAEGLTPNRLVVLVSNLLVFINLILISIDLYKAGFRGGSPEAVETTVARYLTVYAVYTALVVFVVPVVFR